MTQRLKELWNIDSLGVHYFVTYNGTLTPTFDFTSSQGDSNAIFLGKKIGDIPSPDGSDNVDWLMLQNVLGQLANTVYRVDTVKGQPSATVSTSRRIPVPINQPNFFLCSASPDPLISLSSMPQNTVRVHDVMVSLWPLLTSRI